MRGLVAVLALLVPFAGRSEAARAFLEGRSSRSASMAVAGRT
jgi:hypothetical protein